MTSPIGNKSYLSLCTDELSPKKIESKISSLNRQSKCWTVAANVSLIGYVILAAAAFVATASFAPTYITLTSITAILLAVPVADLAKKCLKVSDSVKEESIKLCSIKLHFETLSKQTPAQIQNELGARGIQWDSIPEMQNNPANLPSLNPLLATLKHIEDAMKSCLELKEKLISKAKKLATEDYTKNHQEISSFRHVALISADRALEGKIQAAFLHAVLQKPAHVGNLEEMATFTSIPLLDRIPALALNETTGVDDFLRFKKGNSAPITYREVEQSSVAELGKRFLAAM